jgi:hypothetical protein
MFTVNSYSAFISKLPDAYVATVLLHVICTGPTIRFIVTCYIHDTDWLAYVTSVTEGEIWPDLILSE